MKWKDPVSYPVTIWNTIWDIMQNMKAEKDEMAKSTKRT
jgi:hypothetical protein